MNEVYLEQRMIDSRISLTKDLARHLFARGRQGTVAIVTHNPSSLHAALRKQWLVLLRQVQRERSSTLQAGRILVLSEQIAWMQRVSFTCRSPYARQADIYIFTPAAYQETACVFEALYIADEGPGMSPDLLAATMYQGIVVAYCLQAG